MRDQLETLILIIIIITNLQLEGESVKPTVQFPFLPYYYFFFLMRRPPPRSTLFPYTTLFRSLREFSSSCSCTSSWLLPATLHHSRRDRKSTRLNSSHPSNSYAVFCLKKKPRGPAVGSLAQRDVYRNERGGERPLAQEVADRVGDAERGPELFFLMARLPQGSSLFPYTTLFR